MRLLPKFLWSFSGGEGCNPRRVSTRPGCNLSPFISAGGSAGNHAGWTPVPPAGKDPIHDEKTVQRFIELRASGWTYARLITELAVSKPTLIAWSRKHQFQIQNLKAIELEALREKWLASTTARVDALGAQLRQVEAVLATRDPGTLSTPQLFALARSLRRQIEQATGPVQFASPVAEIPDDEFHDQVQDWQG